MSLHDTIDIQYIFKKGNWAFKTHLLPDDIETKILTELSEWGTLLSFINDNSVSPIVNILNHIAIKIDISRFDMIMSVDMSNDMTQIKTLNFIPYDIPSSIHQSAYVIAHWPYQNLDKNFVFKLKDDGTIPRNCVLYKYMFKMMTDRYKISYYSDLENNASINDYLKIIEMIKI